MKNRYLAKDNLPADVINSESGLSSTKRHIETIDDKICMQGKEGKENKIVKKTGSDNGFENAKSKLWKILYVEDDKYARILMDKYLSKSYLLDLAEDSEQALRMVYTSTYDIILMDINLGNGLNGVELTQLIRRIPAYKTIPVIAVTAAIYPGNEKWILSQGVSYYLPKPFVSNDIHGLLRNVIETVY